ncbi:MAG: 16S rRNA (adenine(1518)-N(6)/adenine(1519)-N(6))-dimethyltransferase RsmA [Proteobacteria bacterium]|nr:16S rRNA (adenine(1518)-N(6)/adenine(1519)-N(6))-dimethyltransferase RsmA [Pseudomonadota bacterium]
MTHSYHQARKRFGQHFLVNETVLEKITAAIGLSTTDHVVEIGPGKGALTQYLLPLVNHLTVIEIDHDLAGYLRSRFENIVNFTLYNTDVLHFDWSATFTTRQRLVGNLPYNITSVLLFQLFEFTELIQDMHFLLQKEVVDRLTAAPGSSNYSRLSVMAQYHANICSLFEVEASCFDPPPRVESAFARFDLHATPPYPAKNFALFAKIVKEAFCYRRKTLANSLSHFINAQQLEQLGIDPHWRPQQISVENFVKISNSGFIS